MHFFLLDNEGFTVFKKSFLSDMFFQLRSSLTAFYTVSLFLFDRKILQNINLFKNFFESFFFINNILLFRK